MEKNKPPKDNWNSNPRDGFYLREKGKKGKVAGKKHDMAHKMGKHGEGYMTYISKKK